MIHAMQPAHLAEALLLGLRCSEVTHRQGLDPAFPLTVSFFAARHTVQPGGDIPLPRNDPYGSSISLWLGQSLARCTYRASTLSSTRAS